MKKILLSGLLAIFYCMVACSQDTPEWINQRPSENDSYIGINYARKSEKDFINIAKQRALEDIASTIFVNLSGEQSLYSNESNNSFSQEYESRIKTSTAAEIEGYEIVDTYQDATEYWVFIRLNKAVFQKRTEEKIAAKLNNATSFLSGADASLKAANFADVIVNLQMAEIALHDAEKYNFMLQTNASYSSLKKQFFTFCNSFSEKIVIMVLDSVAGYSNFNGGNYSLKAKAVYRISPSNAQPVKGVSFRIHSADCTLHDSLLFSGEDGTIHYTITPSNISKTRFAFSFIPFVKNQSGYFSLPVKSQVSVRFEPFKIILTTDEKTFGTNKSTVLLPALKNRLCNGRFTCVAQEKDAQWIISVSANTRQGGSFDNMCIAYCDITLTIADRFSRNVVFSESLSNIKGVKLNWEDASAEAYKNAMKTIDDKLIPKITGFAGL